MKKLRLHIIRIGVYIGKIFLNFIYFFMKLLPTKNKIVMLSRQSDKVNIDFEYIEKELLSRNKKIEIKILCKFINNGLIDKINYCLYILKCMSNIATAKVCIIDGYSIPVSILNHKKELKIIQIWHSSGALKKFGYQSLNKKEGRSDGVAKLMNMHKNYSYVIAPSRATGKFYQEAFNVDKSIIRINCLPRIDYILDENIKVEKEELFFKEYPEYKNKKTILYVPTFRKNVDITPNIQEMIDNVDFEKYNLIIKLHPLEKQDNKYRVDKKFSTFDLIKIADFIITDYSAVAFETSVLDKPVYFYVFDIEKYEKDRGLNINLFKEMKSSTSTDIKDILNSIEEDNYDYDELNKFKIKYMGKEHFNNTKKLVDFIFELIEKDEKNDKQIKNNIDEHSEKELYI